MMRTVPKLATDQRGVALVTTLLFMVLMLILISAMLTVSGNEIVISGLQRDSTRALEVAEGGIREAIRRIEIPHDFASNSSQECYDGNPGDDQTFANSLSPTTATVKICRHEVGPSGAILEIQSDARVNRAIRKLSTIVLQVVEFLPPNILYGQNIAEQGNAAEVGSGDAYSQTYIRYTNLPTEASSLSYGGWRISKRNPGPIPACYSHADCVADALLDGNNCATNPSSDARCRWYPGQRITVPLNSALGQELNALKDDCLSGGISPNDPINGIRAENPSQTSDGFNTYGYDTDDPPPDLPPAPPTDDGPQAVTANLPCGLPYKYVPMDGSGPLFTNLTDEDNNTVTPTRYFKVIVYEHWFLNYYRFDRAGLTWTERNGTNPCPDDPDDPSDQLNCLSGGQEPNIAKYVQFAAVPPFPDFESMVQNADRGPIPPGTINSGDFGYCAQGADSELDTCDGPAEDNRAIVVLLDAGAPGGTPDPGDDWTINGTLDGHGTILVNGDLIINGTFNYWGTIIVNGNLTLGSGNVTVYGGLVAKSTAYLTGNITVMAGGIVPNVPVGSANVTTMTWWER